MSKFVAFFASLLLIPVLALGQNTCPTLTDNEYADFIVAQSTTVSLDDVEGLAEMGVQGTATITMTRNGQLTEGKMLEHVKFKSKLGRGTIDIEADWSVHNALLSIHLVDARHSDTGNSELNRLLDEMLDEVKASPDVSAPLNYCDNFKRSLRGMSFLTKK